MEKYERRDSKKLARKNKIPQHGKNSAQIAARMIVKRAQVAAAKGTNGKKWWKNTAKNEF